MSNIGCAMLAFSLEWLGSLKDQVMAMDKNDLVMYALIALVVLILIKVFWKVFKWVFLIGLALTIAYYFMK